MHLGYHEVIIDVFQVAIATCSDCFVELSELEIEARELISEKEAWEMGINTSAVHNALNSVGNKENSETKIVYYVTF